jgi:hypothetical protein
VDVDAIQQRREAAPTRHPPRGKETAMGAAVVAVLVILAVVVAGVMLARAFSLDEQEHQHHVLEDQHTVRYRVPDGQDPAAVLHALHAAGHDATLAEPPETADVVVVCGDDRMSREEVRAVIARAPMNLGGDPAPGDREDRVRFVGE